MALNTYVTLDVMKQADGSESTYVNLTPNFQGRVGDSRASVDLWFKRNGRPLDLTKRDVSFSGVDPTGERVSAVGFAYYNKPGADEQAGRVNFYFPAGTFKVEGQWDPNSTYFTIRDDKGKVSTIGVLINVLPNMVEMGINAEPFETDLERESEELKKWITAKKDEFTDFTNQLQTMNNTLQTQQTRIETFEGMIQSHAVPTNDEMKAYVNKLMSATEWSGDLNLCLTPTTYLVNSGTSNNPGKGSGNHLLIVKGNSDVLSQLLIDSEQNVWVRSRVSGKWSAWREQVAWS